MNAPATSPEMHTSTFSQGEDITVRRMDFEFDDAIPRYWFNDSKVLTLLLSSLSGVFPEGERMFMDSVRHYEKNITDPELRRQVKAFIGQEAHHGKEHKAFNTFMDKKGVPVSDIDEFTRKGINLERKYQTPERILAKTCALEHFTALLAETLLENPHLIEGMDDRLKPLWFWHAVEESEHKSVAYDVYQDQVDNYWVRVSEMLFITLTFPGFTAYHTHTLNKADAKHTGQPLGKLKMDWKLLWDNRKALKKFGKEYLNYYKRDFHPSQKPNRALRERGLDILRQYNAV